MTPLLTLGRAVAWFSQRPKAPHPGQPHMFHQQLRRLGGIPIRLVGEFLATADLNARADYLQSDGKIALQDLIRDRGHFGV